MEKYLIAEEAIITRSPDDQVVLTSHRIRHATNNGRNVVSIMVDNIDAVRARYESKPWLFVLTAFCLIAALFFVYDQELFFAGMSAAAASAFTLIYFRTRCHIITILSASTAIQFETTGMENGKVLEFLNQIEEARSKLLTAMTLRAL